MEPLTITAVASVLIFKVFEKSGEKLGEATIIGISQLLNLIRKKFKEKGVEGFLTQAQESPTEANKSIFKMMLESQASEDETFAMTLKELVNKLKSDEKVSQILLKNIDVTGSAEIGDVEQITTASSASQEAITDVKVGGNLKIGNIKQQS